MEKHKLLPIEVGTNIIRGQAGKILISNDSLYVKLLTDPVYRQEESRWKALAQVNQSLCLIEVSVYEGNLCELKS